MGRKPLGPSSPSGFVLNQIQVGIRLYEQRYTRCNKPKCRTCHPTNPEFSGPRAHGPYWYLCFRHDKGWSRVYLGKELDTKLFITPEGTIDYTAIFERRRQRRDDAAARRVKIIELRKRSMHDEPEH